MSSLPDGINGVSGIEVVHLCGPPLLILDSSCLALCVRFIEHTIVVLAVLEVWYWEAQCGT